MRVAPVAAAKVDGETLKLFRLRSREGGSSDAIMIAGSRTCAMKTIMRAR